MLAVKSEEAERILKVQSDGNYLTWVKHINDKGTVPWESFSTRTWIREKPG